MIVRIQGEGQYELGDGARNRLDELDAALFAAVESADAAAFGAALSAVVSYVEADGTPIPNDRLVASDVILPASDTTVEEAKRLLTDEGFLTPVEA